MKILLPLLTFICSCAAVSSSHAFQETSKADKKSSPPKLTIGSEAPSLNISTWVSKGNFEEVTDFESDKVYVIEFWATWCIPCRAAMPHVSELQTKYEDQGVQIISVSDESLAKVEKFLKRKNKKTEETYGELTANYCLTTDPDKSVKNDYMRAAGEGGIPVAFIVGKTGQIEWIGHPNQMDKPLEQVVAGKWDRAAAKTKRDAKLKRKAMAAARKKEREANLKIETGKIDDTMELVTKAVVANDMEKAVEIFDEALAINTGKDKNFLRMKKFQVMAKAGVAGSAELFAQYAKEATDKEHKIDLAWSAAKLSRIGAKLSDGTIDEARRLIDEVIADDDDAMLVDIQANLAYFQGNLDEAIKLETQALEGAPKTAKKNLSKFLAELKAEKKVADEKAEEAAEDDKPTAAGVADELERQKQ